MLIGTNSSFDCPLQSIPGGLWEKPVDALQNIPLGLDSGRSFSHKPVRICQQQLPELWARELPLQRHLLPYYGTLIEATSVTEGHNMILKPKIPMMS